MTDQVVKGLSPELVRPGTKMEEVLEPTTKEHKCKYRVQVAQLVEALSLCQSLFGYIKGTVGNDRNPHGFTRGMEGASMGFDLCVAMLGKYPLQETKSWEKMREKLERMI